MDLIFTTYRYLLGFFLKPKRTLGCKNNPCVSFGNGYCVKKFFENIKYFFRQESYYSIHRWGGNGFLFFTCVFHLRINKYSEPDWNPNLSLRFHIQSRYPLHHLHTIFMRIDRKDLSEALFGFSEGKKKETQGNDFFARVIASSRMCCKKQILIKSLQ